MWYNKGERMIIIICILVLIILLESIMIYNLVNKLDQKAIKAELLTQIIESGNVCDDRIKTDNG